METGGKSRSFAAETGKERGGCGLRRDMDSVTNAFQQRDAPRGRECITSSEAGLGDEIVTSSKKYLIPLSERHAHAI
jgi:hypothetical protein